jgi:hypothetical protein
LACVLNSAESSAKRASWTSVKVEKLGVYILKSVAKRTAVKKGQKSFIYTNAIPEVYEAPHHAEHSQTPFQRSTTAYRLKTLPPVQALYVLLPLRVGDLSSVH